MRWLWALLVVVLSAGAARADIPVPDPPAVFSRGQEPSDNTIVAAGAALSAVVVALGLIIGRWPVKTSGGRIGVAAASGVVLLAIWGVAGGTILLVNRDRGLWKQWEIDESNRRANWRGPLDNFPPEPLPPSAPSPESVEAASPTESPKSVQ